MVAGADVRVQTDDQKAGFGLWIFRLNDKTLPPKWAWEELGANPFGRRIPLREALIDLGTIMGRRY
jgi:hypothetical protein